MLLVGGDCYARRVNSLGDLILTKIVPSVRPNQLVRESLVRRLDDVIAHRLTLLHAPAGYGKTSLLTQWHEQLRGRGLQTAWITLEDNESDAGRFAEYVLATIGGGGENLP